jgi:DNA-binding winged helix-turn-helix (wHTH) protein
LKILATPANTARTWRFGVFEVDTRREELRRSGAPVKMREQSFRILVFLLEHAGEIVTREELRGVLWPSDTFVDFEHSLNTAMMKLREALGDVADAPIYIETLPKRGYRFIAAVRINHPGVEPGLPRAMGPAPIHGAVMEAASQRVVARAQPSARAHWWYLAIGVALLVAVASITFVRIWYTGRSTPSMAIEQRLTANPPEAPITGASISPDGKYVAYSDPTGVYLRQIESGETRPLPLPQGFNAAPAGWFPDSTHVLVDIEGSGGAVPSLWKISIFGGSPQKIVENARGGVVSPNGLKIAFLRTGSGVFEI